MEIKLDPVSRVEGHMRVLLDVENGIVKDARCSSTLFRGFEKALINQEPRRAACFTTRICGFCPTSHAMAGAGALDLIYGVSEAIPADAILARNIIQALDFISNHLIHLYLLWLPDLVNPAYKEVISQNLREEFTK
ncbi:MAG: nickel-dependent hydrogenase large subunit, partial [Candidatus Methanoperedens sp.]